MPEPIATPGTTSTQGSTGGGVSTPTPELSGGGAGGAGSSAGQGGSGGAAQTTQGAITGGAGGAGAGAATPSSDFMSVRDALRNYGYPVPEQYQDDHAALQHVIGQLRQAEQSQQLAQYGQQYLRHADQFQAYLRQSEQEAQRRQQGQQQSWWKAPEYDPSWVNKLRRDEQGNLQVLPGHDPAIATKYMAWAEHQRSFFDKFAGDPIGTIKPGIEQVVRDVAQQLMGQQMGQYQAQTQAKSLIEQNSRWLHERDPQGQMVYEMGPQGTPVPRLSAAGRQYAGYVQQAERYGISSVQGQHDFAHGMLQRDLLMGQYQQSQGNAAAGEAAKQQFLQQAAQGGASGQQRQAPPAPAGNVNGLRQVSPDSRGLQQMMMARMSENGYQANQVLARE